MVVFSRDSLIKQILCYETIYSKGTRKVVVYPAFYIVGNL
jgi:hypothetical protein